MTVPEAKSRIYNIASGNVVVDEMVAYVKSVIPEASFSFKPVDDIMAVVAGYKEWTIGCERAAKEIGWRPGYAVGKMADDIIAKVRG
jgi:nucleoside-diphosphate-sugar epimerase